MNNYKFAELKSQERTFFYHGCHHLYGDLTAEGLPVSKDILEVYNRDLKCPDCEVAKYG